MTDIPHVPRSDEPAPLPPNFRDALAMVESGELPLPELSPGGRIAQANNAIADAEAKVADLEAELSAVNARMANARNTPTDPDAMSMIAGFESARNTLWRRIETAKTELEKARKERRHLLYERKRLAASIHLDERTVPGKTAWADRLADAGRVVVEYCEHNDSPHDLADWGHRLVAYAQSLRRAGANLAAAKKRLESY